MHVLLHALHKLYSEEIKIENKVSRSSRNFDQIRRSLRIYCYAAYKLHRDNVDIGQADYSSSIFYGT